MKRIYIDMDGTLCDFIGAAKKLTRIEPNRLYPQSKIGFFKGLKPLPDAIESYRKLEEKYDVWILTRPSFKNVHCYTEKAEWVLKHLGEENLEKLILSPDKSLLIGDYLIDDYGGNGQRNFRGEWIQFGKGSFMNWKSVLEYLL